MMQAIYTRDKNSIEGRLAEILPAVIREIPAGYFQNQRWFRSKSHKIKSIKAYDFAFLNRKLPLYVFLLVRLSYGRSSEIYNLPVTIKKLPPGRTNGSSGLILKTRVNGDSIGIFDAFKEVFFLNTMFKMLAVQKKIISHSGRFHCRKTPVFDRWIKAGGRNRMPDGRLMDVEQSNTSVVYGHEFIIKNIRKLDNGYNPDLEIPLYLTTHTRYKDIPLVAGYIDYAGRDGQTASMASMQTFIANQGDGWKYTLNHLDKFYHHIYFEKTAPPSGIIGVSRTAEAQAVRQFSRSYLDDVYMLGKVTGELHNALASSNADPDFAPEVISKSQAGSWIKGINLFVSEVFAELKSGIKFFPKDIQGQIERLLSHSDSYLSMATGLSELSRLGMNKTRYHGDYHLGQVLKTRGSFIIIDFEGEPARTLKERRTKHTPLKDVAGMLRSFNYAVYSSLFTFSPVMEAGSSLEKWGRIWEKLVREAFLKGYFDVTYKYGLTGPAEPASSIMRVLAALQIEKAVYELRYEQNNRPEWIKIPLSYLLSLIEGEG